MSRFAATLPILSLLILLITPEAKEDHQILHQTLAQDNLLPPDGPNSRSKPESMSLSLTPGEVPHQTGFIRISNPPSLIQNGYRMVVEYSCTDEKFIGVQINVWTKSQTDVSIFSKSWKCKARSTGQHEREVVTIKLPKKLAYRPSYWNPHTVVVTEAILKAWVTDPEFYNTPRWTENNFKYSLHSVQYMVKFPLPYQRMEAPSTHCYSWIKLVEIGGTYKPQCPLEPEIVKLVRYPIALSGTNHGVYNAMEKYSVKELEAERKDHFTDPHWTVVLYLYIVEYCPIGRPLCSIFQRLKWDDLYMTPLVYVNQIGQIHVQLVCENGEPIAHLTTFSLPKDQWIRLVVSMENNRWFVRVNYGKNWKEERRNMIVVATHNSPIWYDSQPALHIVGGSEITPAFQGYVGEATLYRRQSRDPKTIPYPSHKHPMFQLGIGEKAKRCHDFISWIKYRISVHRTNLAKKVNLQFCLGDFYSLFPKFKRPEVFETCDKKGGPRSKAYRFVRKWVKNAVYSGWHFRLEDVGKAIFERAMMLVEESGFEVMSEVVQLLKQSSCYGNHDASYTLASILNHGFGHRADEITAHHYLMLGALDNHRLSLLALGNKHVYGIDNVPQDLEQAYVYYKNMADRSRSDREEHSDGDVHTENIRLTDEYAISEQTEEDGDLFLWFTHQAAQGVVHAQRDLARLMFWGAQGVKRNVKKAVEYYRISAQSGEPGALFDYGLVLLKGQGVEQNYTQALHYLRQAADKGHSGAMNALGWYELEITKNYTAARDIFMKSHHLGNADASHNIGHMFLNGKHPNASGVDRINAFKFFSEGALRGQFDSSIMVATYNIRGHPNVTRSADLAVNWARYVAEISPALGKLLSKGLKNYRLQNWPATLFYYMLAADGGTEVANFNLALLCDENKDGITSYIEKECVWKFFNLSTKREPQFVDSYSWIKMGDYHWYGCDGERNPQQAVIMYANAAVKHDPHAYFNLGFLVEEGLYIPTYILDGLGIPAAAQATNITLLREFYSRCKESYKTEAYIPCTLALFRVEVLVFWRSYNMFIKLSSALGVIIGTVFTFNALYAYLRGQRLSVDAV